MSKRIATFIGIVLSILIPSAVFAYTVGWTYNPTINSVTPYPLATTTVGIGTTTPFGRFGISLNNGENYTGNNAFIIASSTASATTTLFTVSNKGNVGIGTSGQTQALAVTDNNAGVDTQIAALAATNQKAYFRANSGFGVRETFGTDNVGGFMFMETAHPFYIHTGGDFYVENSSATQLITAKSTGNVGIASSTPSAKLDVGGNINLGANNAYQQGDRNILFASTTNSITAGGFGALGLFTSTVSGNNTGETAFGFNALANATSTGHDAAFGYQALVSEGAANQTNGIYNNAAFGYGALQGLTTGTNNVAIGSLAMPGTVTGSTNVAIGQRALNGLSSGSANFGLGFKALNSLTTQSNNVAIGSNTAFGFASTVGSITAIGASAAFGLNGGTYSYDGGGNSVFIGDLSGNVIATSTNNDTCIGHQSCINLSNGSENIIIGSTVNTGGSGITTGGNNVIIAPFNPLGTSATVSNFLNLDNIIFGTGIAATSTSTSLPSLTGNVGIATSTPQHGLSVQTDIQDYGGKADFGTGGNTAIVCYLADGTLGHITITSLLASGNCVAN